jgi:hypothetical protein
MDTLYNFVFLYNFMNLSSTTKFMRHTDQLNKYAVDPLLGNARNTPCNNRKGTIRSVFCVIRAMPIARQRVTKQIPASTNISIPEQQRGKHAFATIEGLRFLCDPRHAHC